MHKYFQNIQEKNKNVYSDLIVEIKKFIKSNSRFYDNESYSFITTEELRKHQEKMKSYLNKSFPIDLVQIQHNCCNPNSIFILHEMNNTYLGLLFDIKDRDNITLATSYIISKDAQFCIRSTSKNLAFEFKYYVDGRNRPVWKIESENRIFHNIDVVPNKHYMINDFIEHEKADSFELLMLSNIEQRNTNIYPNQEERNDTIVKLFDTLVSINTNDNIDRNFKYETMPELLLSSKYAGLEIKDLISLTYDMNIEVDFNAAIDFNFKEELNNIEVSFKKNNNIVSRLVKKFYL